MTSKIPKRIQALVGSNFFAFMLFWSIFAIVIASVVSIIIRRVMKEEVEHKDIVAVMFLYFLLFTTSFFVKRLTGQLRILVLTVAIACIYGFMYYMYKVAKE